MRILITGATSAVGRMAAGRLVAAGHRVSAIAQRPHPLLDPRVELVCAGLDEPILRELTEAADVVLHLAPIEDGLPESAGIGGVVRVTHAAGRAGARLLFLSQAAGDPALYGEAEDLVASSWGPTLIIRMALPVGRQADWMVCRTAATLLTAGITRPVRVLHSDDLHRFLARSVASHRTGIVDVATTDAVTGVTARRWLGSVDGRARRMPTWHVPEPDLRVIPLQRDWEFECGWTAAEAVADTGRALAGRRLGADSATAIPGRLPMSVEVIPRDTARVAAVRHAAPLGLSGEFDDLIDPRFPVFTTRCTSDALPGSLTPMTLDVHGAGLRAAHLATADIIGLRGELAREWGQRAVAVFAHRIFVGVSVTMAAAEVLPAGDPETLAVLLEDASPGGHSQSHARRRLSRPVAGTAARVFGIARRYADWCGEFATASSLQSDTPDWAKLRDAQLDVRIELLCNRIRYGWTLAMVGALAEGLIGHAAGRRDPVLALLAVTTATAHLADETAALAELLRADRRLRELAAAADLTAIRSSYPAAAAAFDAAVARIGHRGPGEAELANPVIVESTGQLLAAAALAAAETPAPRAAALGKPSAAQRRADGVRVARESAWDTTARYTHRLRTALREKGRRLTTRRLLATDDDVFYLTVDEVLAPPVDARLRVSRRRAEHVRLQALHMPDVIDGTWTPVEDEASPPVIPTITAPEPEVTTSGSLAPQGQA